MLSLQKKEPEGQAPLTRLFLFRSVFCQCRVLILRIISHFFDHFDLLREEDLIADIVHFYLSEGFIFPEGIHVYLEILVIISKAVPFL